MNRFGLHISVEKEKIKTKFGVVSIRNVKFDSTDIQNILPDIIFEDDNLKFMFQKDTFLGRDKALVLKRFLPNKNVKDITKFIIDSINSNKTFYSFLAEGMLGLVFRDIYGYDLSVGIIDINETLTDTHTGSDACMFDKNIVFRGIQKCHTPRLFFHSARHRRQGDPSPRTADTDTGVAAIYRDACCLIGFALCPVKCLFGKL